MERCVWSVRVLFVAITLIGVHGVDSISFGIDGSKVRPRRIQAGDVQRISNQRLLSLHHSVDKENADTFDRNLDDQFGSGDPTRTARLQLLQAGPNPEVEVLTAFKGGITDDPLHVLSSWNSNDSNPCHWRGVTCDQRQNSVLALDLDDLQLTGTVSPLLGTLQNLQHINLSVNFFNGGIPTSLLNCSHLTHLALHDNNLNGSVPSELGNLRNLQVLDLSNNVLLGGDLPASLGNCTDLRRLDLHFTTVGGMIPETLGKLSNLEFLNLTYTLSSGTVPKSLGNCSALAYLDIGNLYATTDTQIDVNDTISGIPPSAYLSGELPAELGQLTRLRTLGVFGASIVGAFPSWIANLTSLNELGLGSFFLTGEIPDFLGTLPLELLALSHTYLTGSIPEAIFNCTNLWFLAIEASYTTGPIPHGVGKLRKLGTLSFVGNNLMGKIPPSISNCSRLRVASLGSNPLMDLQPVPSWVASLVNLTDLDLSGMNLVGAIPRELGQISKLDSLALDNNQLRGGIPNNLGNCTELIYLELENNILTGELPLEIWSLPYLVELYVQVNDLTIFPQSIGNFSQLQYLGVSDNLFTGEIPVQLAMFQQLVKADFSGNKFSGPIPHSIGNCSSLQYLNFSHNQMTGSLPTSLGNLTALGQFSISANHLEGQIPTDLARCSSLLILDFSQNFLDSSVPEDLGFLVYLQTLDLSQNSVSGSLPLELGNLSSLLYLDFSFNNFSGYIPSSLGDCDFLESLDLSMNNLSGSIPQNLGQLLRLAFVNMSYNHLEGALPRGGLFSSSNLSAASFLGNPGLCGNLFLKDCPPQLSPTNAPHCQGFRCHGARVAALTVGAVVGLMIMGAITYITFNGLVRGGWRGDGQASLQLYQGSTGLTLSSEELLNIMALPENIIGTGARSTVYKATLTGGVLVAVKVLNIGDADDDVSRQAHAELHREAHHLSCIRHRSVVRVLGLTTNQKFAALYLEYVPNGSLYNHLYSDHDCGLDWRTRLNIAVGIAEGVFYLHHQAMAPIIHRDLKPANILLNADLVPKLGDFGISKLVSPKNEDRGETMASTFCGTTGYFPPEYGASTVVSTKGDVYSYGVILLELLTRKHPVLADNESSDVGLTTGGHIVDLVRATWQETPFALVDPMLLVREDDTVACSSIKAHEREQMKMFMRVALLCTQEDPERRPAISDVLGMLRQILERGSDPPDRPTLEELANEISGWQTEDLNEQRNSISI